MARAHTAQTSLIESTWRKLIGKNDEAAMRGNWKFSVSSTANFSILSCFYLCCEIIDVDRFSGFGCGWCGSYSTDCGLFMMFFFCRSGFSVYSPIWFLRCSIEATAIVFVCILCCLLWQNAGCQLIHRTFVSNKNIITIIITMLLSMRSIEGRLRHDKGRILGSSSAKGDFLHRSSKRP